MIPLQGRQDIPREGLVWALPVRCERHGMARNCIIVVCIMLGLLALVPACQSSSRALTLIAQNKCLDCHTLNGKGGAVGPALTTVGSRRDRAYIYQQIKDPKSHNPRTDMPSFGDRIPDQDINILADYLTGMK